MYKNSFGALFLFVIIKKNFKVKNLFLFNLFYVCDELPQLRVKFI